MTLLSFEVHNSAGLDVIQHCVYHSLEFAVSHIVSLILSSILYCAFPSMRPVGHERHGGVTLSVSPIGHELHGIVRASHFDAGLLNFVPPPVSTFLPPVLFARLLCGIAETSWKPGCFLSGVWTDTT